MNKLPIPIESKQTQSIKFDRTKSFTLKENFKLKISINEKLIFLEIEKLNIFPKKDFNIYLSLEELRKINNFFYQFETTDEILSSFEIMIEEKNISTSEEERKIKLKIMNPAKKKRILYRYTIKRARLKE